MNIPGMNKTQQCTENGQLHGKCVESYVVKFARKAWIVLENKGK